MMKEAVLWEKIGEGVVRCGLCSHRCKIKQDKFGLCGVRQNRDGSLYTLVYGEAITAHADPIEKKPLYHFLPGSKAYSIAAMGCNFSCSFCQNWQISQTNKRDLPLARGYEFKPEDVVKEAKKNHCKSISYTYTEPTVFFEYAHDTAKLAKAEGLYNSFVTNGYMTKEALDIIRPYLDACNVDLKSFNEAFYKDVCKASLGPVLESIKYMKKIGIWVEITTLIVPGVNDSKDEFKNIAGFIASVDKDIPWHISRFHPDYKLTNSEATPLETLKKAENIGKNAGLNYIYIGNVLGESEDTICYNCNNVLIKREGFTAEIAGLNGSRCAKCNTEIKGVF